MKFLTGTLTGRAMFQKIFSHVISWRKLGHKEQEIKIGSYVFLNTILYDKTGVYDRTYSVTPREKHSAWV